MQLYSLTNGYHRYLSLEGLKQNEWLAGAVDMTEMRRPDGTGGPLSENERIDDIQFYVDPRAELLIDDIVLFDAETLGGKRPFPKRLLYTGWFDAGKQGKEWPGDFEIVDHVKPRTGKAAKSVLRKGDGEPWIRLDIRGERDLDRKTDLSFKYKVADETEVKVQLYSRAARKVVASQTVKLPSADWGERTLSFTTPLASSVDEIRFLLTEGELIVDDVLLYSPGG